MFDRQEPAAPPLDLPRAAVARESGAIELSPLSSRVAMALGFGCRGSFSMFRLPTGAPCGRST